MENLLAQGLIIQPTGGPAVTIQGPLVGINSITDVIQIIINFAFPFAAIVLLFVLIWGGYDLLVSRGEPEKIQAGRNKITAGIIGFILLMLSYVITQVIGFIFDIGGGLF